MTPIRCALLIGLVGAVLSAPTFAAPDDGEVLLRKVASAGRQLTYSGVFVYRSGKREETSRIVHALEMGRPRERIEVLDGSPREVVRDGHEVKCYLPEEKLLIVESHSRRRGFPSALPNSATEIGQFYRIRTTQSGRVAGIESRGVMLEPRDGYRYAHELWVDPVSGLLLKATMLGEAGEPIESFAFTQVKIGGPLDKSAFLPRFDTRQITVKRVEADELRPEDLPWVFVSLPPGFRVQSAMRRPASAGAGGSDKEILHVVFSDGLAAISVFIGPEVADMDEGLSRAGPVHVFKRRLDGFQAVVMGEVPAVAVSRLGNGIERRAR